MLVGRVETESVTSADVTVMWMTEKRELIYSKQKVLSLSTYLSIAADHVYGTLQLIGFKGSAAYILVPDTTAHLQGSSGVHASTEETETNKVAIEKEIDQKKKRAKKRSLGDSMYEPICHNLLYFVVLFCLLGVLVKVSTLRDNRIDLIRASWQELTISIREVALGDEGLYTCSLFTMPVKTAKAYLTVLGVPEKPEINGFTKPAMEGDQLTLTCVTSGSKPAADIRWFRNEKEIKGAKEVNASGKTFTVRSSVQLQVDRNDDGVAYTCKVVHEALRAIPQQTTEVLEVHLAFFLLANKLSVHADAPRVEIRHSQALPQEGDVLKLECVSNGNPSPDPVKWTKDGGKLPDLDRVIVDGRDLTFISLNKTDNGTYRCEASNHLGTNHAEYVLFVYDAPTTPSPSTTPPPVAILPDTTDPLDFKPNSGQRELCVDIQLMCLPHEPLILHRIIFTSTAWYWKWNDGVLENPDGSEIIFQIRGEWVKSV
ncbi:hypothetical protein QTP70_004964 [Hemibagrus guttatus]|uniref:Ig-like domain-containing protein n=1 Tax=Hemibagrus guttatus TaxID=175788 RepID=A0AAE0QIB7_9TELE|nr:hypothetical protein QTP70_004964 [Hemibagrus guttatus]